MHSISKSIYGSTHTPTQRRRYSRALLLTPAITQCGRALFPILFYHRQEKFLMIIMNNNLYKKESLHSNLTNVMRQIIQRQTANGVSLTSQNFLQALMAFKCGNSLDCSIKKPCSIFIAKATHALCLMFVHLISLLR